MPTPRSIVPDGGIRPGQNNHASVAIAAKRIVKLDPSNGVDAVALAVAATAALYGVTREQIPAVGKVGDVQVRGKAIVTAGGTVAIGDTVSADSAGKAVADTTDAHFILGPAISAGGAGEDIEVELMGPGAQRAS